MIRTMDNDYDIPANPSAFCRICPHLNHVFRIRLKILRNHKFYRISIDSHQMDVKSLIQCTLLPSKDDLWVVVLYAMPMVSLYQGQKGRDWDTRWTDE